MKSKFFISGLLISITLLTASCSTDDIDEQMEANTKTSKIIELKEKINATANDSIIPVSPEDDGDPVIVIPPRKN